MNLTLDTIYDALKDSVRFYPRQESDYLQPQTWRALQKSLAAEITGKAGNFGATICDKGKPYFWSRHWHESKYKPDNIVGEYPLLYAFEQGGDMVAPFGSSGVKYITNMEIGVVDIFSEDAPAQKCIGRNARSINEIYRDTQAILEACLNYLKEVKAYRINESSEGWYNSKMIEQAISAGTIYKAEWVPGTLGIADAANQHNRTAQYSRAERSAVGVYGTYISLRFEVAGCCETNWNFNLPDFGVLAHEAGCKDC